jgi:biopolymer transport protein ExbD
MAPKARVTAGCVVVLLASLVFCATERWFTTRIFEPVNTPITLHEGRFETEFRLNLREEYAMQIELGNSPDDWAGDEADKCNVFRLRQVEWRILRLAGSKVQSEELWAEWDPASPLRIFWSEFRATPGRYRARLEIPASAACLNPRDPRLIIWTDRYSYNIACGWIEFLCFLIGSSGVLLALRGVWQWLIGLFQKDSSLRMLPEIAVRNVTVRVQHRPMAMISGFTNLTVAWIGVLSALVVIFYWWLILPIRQYGWTIDFKTTKVGAAAVSPWAETMSVYIDGQGRFFVNGKIVDETPLEERLREELSKRAVWTVYVEADAGSSFQETAYAMDAIEGLGGKVIWITPKTRKEWEESKEKPLVRVHYPSGAHGWRRPDPTE